MSNRSIRENLNLLVQTKDDIKNAINFQGGTVNSSTPFNDYADQIDSFILGDGIYWPQIGFKNEPEEIMNGYAHAKYMVDNKDELPNIGTNILDVSNDIDLVYLPSCSALGVDPNDISVLSFYNCINLMYIKDKVLHTSKVRFTNNTFSYCYNLKNIPQLDISTYYTAVANNGLFNKLYSLDTIDPSNNTEYWYTTSYNMGFSSLFRDCYSLKTLPVIDCGKLPANNEKIDYMFYNCKSLTDVSIINTSNITEMGSLFSGCTSLTNVPLMDTQNVISMSFMFDRCNLLTTIPQMDTQNVIRMMSMFKDCTSLTTIPSLNTQNVSGMTNMFSGCTSLTNVPLMDTQNVINMNYMFHNCIVLTTIDGLDFKSIPSESAGNLTGVSLNIRKMYIKNIGYSSCPTYDFSKITRWGLNTTDIPDASLSIYKSLVEDTSNRANAGSSTVNIKLSTSVLNQLNNEIKAAICAKGYTLNGISY